MFHLEKLAKKDLQIFFRDVTHHFIYTIVIVGISSIVMYILLSNVVKQQISSLLTLAPFKTTKVVVVPGATANGDIYGDSYTERGSPYDNRTVGNQNANVIFHGSRDKKEIAITFDAEMTDGMKANLLSGRVQSSYDKRIIETLISTNTKATLFLTGMWIELYPDVTKALSQNNLFELGSHSYTDSSYNGFCFGLGQLPNTLKIEEIGATEKLLREHAGIDNHLFRFPGGCYTPDDVKLVNEANDIVVHWDVVGADGFNSNTYQIIRNVVDNVQNGSIIVLHMNGAPTAPQTADALPEIIRQLKSKGFEFVKVNELLGVPPEAKG